MNKDFHFCVPGKPQPLQRARVQVRNGKPRHYTPKASVEYQKKVRYTALMAQCPLFAKGCEVELFVYLPDRRRRDRDNILKNVLDALQGSARLKRRPIAWDDDNDVGKITVDWAVDRANPRVEVTIRGLTLGS